MTATYQADGWPLAPNDHGYPGLKLCCTQNIAPCARVPVWRTQKHDRHGSLTGYYCDDHLPAEHRSAGAGRGGATWKLDPDFADVVLGERPGVLCAAIGREPYRNDKGHYGHRSWRDVLLNWPTDREELEAKVAEALATGDPVDIYLCPAIRQGNAKGRRKGDALPPKVLWADLDGEPKDAELYRRLVAGGSLVVSSGSDGHRHLYLPLARPVDLGTFNTLNKALAERLGADSKWADNSVLRMPGTLNWKPTVPPGGVAAGPPARVAVVR